MTYDDESIMPFGEHKGKKLLDVPASWLLWAYDNIKGLELGLKKYIQENMKQLLTELGELG